MTTISPHRPTCRRPGDGGRPQDLPARVPGHRRRWSAAPPRATRAVPRSSPTTCAWDWPVSTPTTPARTSSSGRCCLSALPPSTGLVETMQAQHHGVDAYTEAIAPALAAWGGHPHRGEG